MTEDFNACGRCGGPTFTVNRVELEPGDSVTFEKDEEGMWVEKRAEPKKEPRLIIIGSELIRAAFCGAIGGATALLLDWLFG